MAVDHSECSKGSEVSYQSGENIACFGDALEVSSRVQAHKKTWKNVNMDLGKKHNNGDPAT